MKVYPYSIDSSILLCEDDHIRKNVHIIDSIEENSLILFNEVPSLCFDDIPTKFRVQHHEHLIFFLVLEREIVLLVYFVIALDRVLQEFIVDVPFLDF